MRFAPLLVLLAGCTTLGPNPSTTGFGARPLARPGGEIGIGIAPGHFLSAGVTEEPEGAAFPQASALFEPDDLIGVSGLMIGARLTGDSDVGVLLEPVLGYRRELGRFALAGLAFGTHSSKRQEGEARASYSATRLGAEVAGDVRLTPPSKIIELHLYGGGALTWLDAEGRYCVSPSSGYGVDCPDEPEEPRTMAEADVAGVYPTGHAGVAIELGRHLASSFRGARVAVAVSGGWMPTLVAGREGRHLFASLGLSLAVALGRADPPRSP